MEAILGAVVGGVIAILAMVTANLFNNGGK